MLRRRLALRPQQLGKSLVIVLILITPGSFLILPLLALIRLRARRKDWPWMPVLRQQWLRVRQIARAGTALPITTAVK